MRKLHGQSQSYYLGGRKESVKNVMKNLILGKKANFMNVEGVYNETGKNSKNWIQ